MGWREGGLKKKKEEKKRRGAWPRPKSNAMPRSPERTLRPPKTGVPALHPPSNYSHVMTWLAFPSRRRLDRAEACPRERGQERARPRRPPLLASGSGRRGRGGASPPLHAPPWRAHALLVKPHTPGRGPQDCSCKGRSLKAVRPPALSPRAPPTNKPNWLERRFAIDPPPLPFFFTLTRKTVPSWSTSWYTFSDPGKQSSKVGFCRKLRVEDCVCVC